MNLKFLEGKKENEFLTRFYTKDKKRCENRLHRLKKELNGLNLSSRRFRGCVEDIKESENELKKLKRYIDELNKLK